MKKKVLHVSAGGLNHGGVGTVIFAIVESLHEQFDFSCVVFSRKSAPEQKFEKYGKLYRINCYPRKGKRNYMELITRPFKLYFGIRKICRSEQFDVIHCHNQRDEWICLLAAKHEHVPIRIAHSHNPNSSRKVSAIEKVYKNISPIMLNRVANVKVGCSKVACEQFYNSEQFTVVPNSIDLSGFSIEKRVMHSGVNFVHVGRFTYQKNQEFVIETFSEICKQLSDAHLFLVGYGEKDETERLRKLIAELGISDHVEMVPGDKVNIVDYYAKSDYMIFPSRYEGFGIVLIEAQAMGVYCYGSENIQPEADVGMLSYMRLSDGPQKWANKIVADVKNGEKGVYNQAKLMQYSNAAISDRYAEIYNGVKK